MAIDPNVSAVECGGYVVCGCVVVCDSSECVVSVVGVSVVGCEGGGEWDVGDEGALTMNSTHKKVPRDKESMVPEKQNMKESIDATRNMRELREKRG